MATSGTMNRRVATLSSSEHKTEGEMGKTGSGGSTKGPPEAHWRNSHWRGRPF